ncbi:hypothetical protein J2X20_005654 [Pelomonas saccharophila]|uniref:Uncharacterized protein n=1 Tax=Roseateles saccharophilus TaxID=304 RepID=A0ABU1YVS9_ROSSA|nr:hypothetical protein [Roseateles saccharophilus]
MLSPSTLSLLSELQEKSHAAYSEGGLLYTYVEASNQAHSRYPESAVGSTIRRPSELADLGRFLQASQGDYVSEAAAPQFLLAAQQLMEHLRADLHFDEMILLLEDGGHDMEATVKMARRSDNRFFELELWWSID